MKWQKVTRLDIREIAEIEKQSFEIPWNEKMLGDELENPFCRFYKLTEEDRLIAYGFFYVIADTEAHIGNVCVREEYRGKGYGKLFLNNLLTECRLQQTVGATLEVRESNLVAIKLYESVGFKNVGKRPGYYNGKEDAIIMWLYF